jgi:copper(I)-binding protein
MKQLLLAALLAPACVLANAQVSASDAWIRATVIQQKATGVFMQLNAKSDTRLVEIRSSVASAAEMHQMSFENNVMRMRQVSAIELRAATPVALAPGGYHIMLLGLTQPLVVGQHVPITLVFEARGKRRESIVVDAVVRPLTGSAPAPAAHTQH